MLILFFPFNKNNPGGVQSLLINIGFYLVGKNIEFKLIDRDDGILFHNLKQYSDKFKFIHINDKNLNKKIENDDIIILTTFSLISYLKGVNCRVLLWSVGIDPFLSDYYTIYGHKIPIISRFFQKKFIKYLHTHNSLVFMDNKGPEIIKKFFDYVIKPVKIVPIPIYIPNENEYNKKCNNNEVLTISYIGRAVKWKINPFIKLLEDMKNLKLENITIILITDDVQAFKSQLPIFTSQMPIQYFENITGNYLKEFLIKNVSIAFGMGTVALESASLGIPTVLIDGCNDLLPNNYQNYRWLYDSEDTRLGNMITKLTPYFLHTKGKSLDLIFKEFMLSKYIISTSVYEYVTNHFSIDKVLQNLLLIISNSSAELKVIKRFAIKSIIKKRKIY